MVLLLSTGCGLLDRSIDLVGAMRRGAFKPENKNLGVPDRARRASGNHNFHRLPPKMLEPARCKFRRSKQSLPRSLKASASNALADAIKGHAKIAAPHRNASKSFFSIRENKCAAFAGKFRELSIEDEQNRHGKEIWMRRIYRQFFVC